MFRVDREQRSLVTSDLAHEDASRRYEALLVGERGACSLAHGGKRWLQTCGANDCRHHPIRGTACGVDERVGSGSRFDACARESCAKIGVAALIRDDGKLRLMLNGEIGEARGVAPSGQGHHRVRGRIAADEIESVLADRTRGAEHRDTARLRLTRGKPDGFRMSGEHGHSQRLTR